MTEAYPLQWPPGWPRTIAGRRAGQLGTGGKVAPGWNIVVRRLMDQLGLVGATNIILSTNQPLRQDGLPFSRTSRIDDPGAAIYFSRGGREFVMAQDKYQLLADNIRSLALAIEGLRQMERHGGAVMVERAFNGFLALPPPGGTSADRPWPEVLDVPPALRASYSLGAANARYRELARRFHPDQGTQPDAVRMAELTAAIAAARRELSP